MLALLLLVWPSCFRALARYVLFLSIPHISQFLSFASTPACLLLIHRLLPRIANIPLLHPTFFPSISLLSLLHSFQQLLNAGLFIIAFPLRASASVPELLLCCCKYSSPVTLLAVASIYFIFLFGVSSRCFCLCLCCLCFSMPVSVCVYYCVLILCFDWFFSPFV